MLIVYYTLKCTVHARQLRAKQQRFTRKVHELCWTTWVRMAKKKKIKRRVLKKTIIQIRMSGIICNLNRYKYSYKISMVVHLYALKWRLYTIIIKVDLNT